MRPVGVIDGFEKIDGVELMTKGEAQRRKQIGKKIAVSIRNVTENMAMNLIVGRNA